MASSTGGGKKTPSGGKKDLPMEYDDGREQTRGAARESSDRRHEAHPASATGKRDSNHGSAYPNQGTRIILVGKTGAGKSTLGNRLLQKQDVKRGQEPTAGEGDGHNTERGFVVGKGFQSETAHCTYKESAVAWGRHMKVLDTPGLFDTSVDLERTLTELTKVLCLSVPGPHAVIFVTRCDNRFTDEEYQAFMKIAEMLGEEGKQFLIVVFTRGEDLEENEITIEDKLKDAPERLREILDIVENRYAVVGRTKDQSKRDRETLELLAKVDMVSNQGSKFYYNSDSRELCRHVYDEILKEMQTGDLSWEEAEMKVKTGLATNDSAYKRLQLQAQTKTVTSSDYMKLSLRPWEIPPDFRFPSLEGMELSDDTIAKLEDLLKEGLKKIRSYRKHADKGQKDNNACTML